MAEMVALAPGEQDTYKIVAVVNELVRRVMPVEDNATGALQAANNLSDVADAAASRENLGLGLTDSVQFDQLRWTRAFQLDSVDLNTVLTSGFYDCVFGSNLPTTASWHYLLVMRHSNTDGWVQQVAWPLTDDGMGNVERQYIRRRVNSVWSPWVRIGAALQQSVGVSTTPLNLTAFDSGKMYTNFNANRVINLPALQDGILFGFFTTAGELTINAPAGAILFPGPSNVTSILLRDGDHVIMLCDGANWVVLSSGLRARQVDQEGTTSGTRYVAPAVQHFHPSAAKVFAEWDLDTSADANWNVSSITDAAGNWTVNFSIPFSSVEYVPLASLSRNNVGSNAAANIRITAFGSAKAAGSVQVLSHNGSDNLADPSGGSMHLACFGDQ